MVVRIASNSGISSCFCAFSRGGPGQANAMHDGTMTMDLDEEPTNSQLHAGVPEYVWITTNRDSIKELSR